jgi:outer membrane protein assembly factor BamE
MFRTPPTRRVNAASLSALLALTLASAGCSSIQADQWLGAITPYRVDVMQGNVITQELAARVKPGMSREQVRDLLGSPLLTSAFHADRWDYVFTMRRQGIEPQRRSVVAHFKGDVLDRLDSPELPTEKDFVGSIRPSRSGGAEPLLALSEERRKALPPPVKGEAAAVAQPQGANRPYPPLEPQ